MNLLNMREAKQQIKNRFPKAQIRNVGKDIIVISDPGIQPNCPNGFAWHRVNEFETMPAFMGKGKSGFNLDTLEQQQ